MAPTHPSAHIPRNTTAAIRRRWLDLLDLSHTQRRVMGCELERGVHAIVAPAGPLRVGVHSTLQGELEAVLRSIPRMAHRVRVPLHEIRRYDLDLEEDFRRWMGRYGADLASGRAQALVFIDLAYLEAALLDRFLDTGVEMRFRVPISRFRRGELTDYENVLEAAARTAFECRSLMDTATELAQATLLHLETCAQAFLRLAGLYAEAHWRIHNDTFLMELPARGISLTLRYSELRNGVGSTLETWQRWIESLLEDTTPARAAGSPQSFAA